MPLLSITPPEPRTVLLPSHGIPRSIRPLKPKLMDVYSSTGTRSFIVEIDQDADFLSVNGNWAENIVRNFSCIFPLLMLES